MRGNVKWVVLPIAVVFGMAAVLACITLIALSRSSGERYLRDILQDEVGRFLGQRVGIGELETDVLFRIKLLNVSVTDTLGGMDTPLLTLGEAEAGYNLFALFLGKFTIHSLRMRDLAVSIVTDSTGYANLPHIPSFSGPIAFEIRRVSLTRSRLLYKNRSIPIDSDLADVSCDVVGSARTGYSVRASVDSVRFAYKNVAISTSPVVVRGGWYGSRFRVDDLAVSLRGMNISLRDFEYSAGSDSLLAGRIVFEGETSGIASFVGLTFAPGIPSVSGKALIEAKLGGTPANAHVALVLAAPDIDFGGVGLGNLHLKGSWENRTARVESLSVDTFGGTVRGSGTFDARTRTAGNVSLDFDGLGVRDIGRLAGLHFLGGRISGFFEGDGPIDDPGGIRAYIALRTRGLAYRNRGLPDISGEISLAEGIADIELAAGESNARAKAGIAGGAADCDFTLYVPRISDFQAFADSSEVAGEIAARGTLRGRWRSPEIHASFDGHSIKYDNFPVDSLEGAVTWKNGSLSFADMRGSGHIASFESLRSRLHADGLTGGMRYECRIDGSLSSPRADIKAHLEKPSYKGVSFDSGDLCAEVRGDTLRVSHAILDRGPLRIHGKSVLDYCSLAGTAEAGLMERACDGGLVPHGEIMARFDLENAHSVDMGFQARALSPGSLKALVPFMADIGGTVDCDGTIAGDLENPDAKVVFRAVGPGFRTTYLDSLRGGVILRGRSVRVEPLELFRGDFRSVLTASLALEKVGGVYRISQDAPVSGRFRGDGFPLVYVGDLFPRTGKIDGAVSYDIAFDGVLSDPRPSGIVEISNFSLNSKEESPLIQGVDIHAVVRNDIMTLKVRNGSILKQPYTLEAVLNYTPPELGGTVDLFLAGEKALNASGVISKEGMRIQSRMDGFNLSLLRGLSPSLATISGLMNASLSVEGPYGNPKTAGAVRITGLDMDIPGVDMPVRNGTIRLDISPSRIIVDTLFVASGAGSISVSGALYDMLSESARRELKATIQNVRVRKADLFDMNLGSAGLNIKRTGNDYSITGDANLGESRILFDPGIRSFLKKAQGTVTNPPPDFFRQVHLDIGINGGDRLSIRNSLAKIPMRADLKLIGTLEAPDIMGEVTAEEGEVYYMDRTFKVTESTIEFSDRSRLNPSLNINAETKVKALGESGSEPYTVSLAVSGTMEKPEVRLTSDPALDVPNIVSLLTIGVTRQQVGFGSAAGDTTSSLKDILQERAEVLTSRQVGGYIGSRLGNALGFQLFCF